MAQKGSHPHRDGSKKEAIQIVMALKGAMDTKEDTFIQTSPKKHQEFAKKEFKFE